MALFSGLICHASFVLGVGAMVLAMFDGMSRSLGTVPPPWSWLANAALLAQFPVLHSALLSSRGRRLLARLGPRGSGPVLSTTTFATIAAAQVFCLFALWSPSGVVWWQAQGTTLTVIFWLYVGSWAMLIWSMYSAGLGLQTGSLGWFALLRGRPPRYPPMPRHGLFRLVRQPIYVAFALTLWTVPTWTPDQLVVAVVLTTYCVLAPRLKERRYRQIYGAEFERYCQSVPYWLPWPRRRAHTGDDGRLGGQPNAG